MVAAYEEISKLKWLIDRLYTQFKNLSTIFPIFLKKPLTFFCTFSPLEPFSSYFYFYEPGDTFFSIFLCFSYYFRSYFYRFSLYFCIYFSTFFLPFYAKCPKSSSWYSWTSSLAIAITSRITICSLISWRCSRTTVNSF